MDDAFDRVLRGMAREAEANTTYAAALARRAGYSLPDVAAIVQQAAWWREATPWWVWAELVMTTPWVARRYRRQRWGRVTHKRHYPSWLRHAPRCVRTL